MLPGTVAEAVFDDRVRDTPPEPAGALKVTLPVAGDPPVTEVGLRVTLPMAPCPAAGGSNTRVAATLFADAAVIVMEVEFATGEVETAKVPAVCPPAIRIFAGTVAEPLFVDRLTVTPLAPAGAFKVTVPVEGEPPVTEVGVRVMLPIAPWLPTLGLKASVVDTLFAEAAVIVTAVELATAEVETVNVPVV